MRLIKLLFWLLLTIINLFKSFIQERSKYDNYNFLLIKDVSQRPLTRKNVPIHKIVTFSVTRLQILLSALFGIRIGPKLPFIRIETQPLKLSINQ